MNKPLLGIAAVLLFSIGLAAQDIPKAEVYMGYGFLRFNPSGAVNAFSANGGLGSFQFNINNHFGIVGELGGFHNGALSVASGPTRQPDQTSFTYLFGPRVFLNKAGVVSPFFEFLAGGFHNSRSFSVPDTLLPRPVPIPPGVTVSPGIPNTVFRSTQNAAALLLGGGVDIRLSRLIAFRPIEVDYLPTHFSPFNIPGLGQINSTTWQNNLRYSAGVTLRFGGATPPPPKASCTANPAELLPWGGPVTASVQTADFHPKHSLEYAWNSTGGPLAGQGTSATLDTGSLAPGNYTVTANVTDPKEKKLNSASCSASFTVKQPQPPVVGCSATPSTVHPGEAVTINARGSSPDVSRIQDRKFVASAGAIKAGETNAGNQPGEFTTTATLDTAGVQPGPVNVTIGVTDVHGLSGSCVATATVVALPAPETVVSETLITECNFNNEKKRARVDNECKATLDEVALRLQHEPNGKLVVVGYAEEDEEATFKNVEALRAANVKKYLTSGEAKQQVDTNRIEIRQSSSRGNGQKAKFYLVPEGGTFTVKDTTIIDETQLPKAPQ